MSLTVCGSLLRIISRMLLPLVGSLTIWHRPLLMANLNKISCKISWGAERLVQSILGKLNAHPYMRLNLYPIKRGAICSNYIPENHIDYANPVNGVHLRSLRLEQSLLSSCRSRCISYPTLPWPTGSWWSWSCWSRCWRSRSCRDTRTWDSLGAGVRPMTEFFI